MGIFKKKTFFEKVGDRITDLVDDMAEAREKARIQKEKHDKLLKEEQQRREEALTIKGDEFREKLKYELFTLKVELASEAAKSLAERNKARIDQLVAKIKTYEDEIVKWDD